MKIRRFKVVAAVIVLTGIVVNCAFSFDGDGPGRGRQGPPGEQQQNNDRGFKRGNNKKQFSLNFLNNEETEKLLKEQGISESAIAEFTELAYQNLLNKIKQQSSIMQYQIMLAKALSAESPDQSQVEQVVDKLNTAKSESYKSEILFQLKSRKLLGNEVFSSLSPMPSGQMSQGFRPPPPHMRGGGMDMMNDPRMSSNNGRGGNGRPPMNSTPGNNFNNDF